MFLELVLPVTQPVWPLPAQSWSWGKTITGSEGWLYVAPEGVLQFHQQLLHYRYQHWGQRPVLLLQSVLRQRHEGPALQAQEQVPGDTADFAGSSGQGWLWKVC